MLRGKTRIEMLPGMQPRMLYKMQNENHEQCLYNLFHDLGGERGTCGMGPKTGTLLSTLPKKADDVEKPQNAFNMDFMSHGSSLK